jgi:hypothetical protein
VRGEVRILTEARDFETARHLEVVSGTREKESREL